MEFRVHVKQKHLRRVRRLLGRQGARPEPAEVFSEALRLGLNALEERAKKTIGFRRDGE